jgi:CYTH domain-containing protein
MPIESKQITHEREAKRWIGRKVTKDARLVAAYGLVFHS